MTLKELRAQSGLTAAKVAEALGVTESAISNYENGKRMIGIEQVLKLSKLYDYSAEDIINAQLNSYQKALRDNLL